MLEFTKETNDALLGCHEAFDVLRALMYSTPAVISSLPPTCLKAHELIVNTRRHLLVLDAFFKTFVELASKSISEVPRKDRRGSRAAQYPPTAAVVPAVTPRPPEGPAATVTADKVRRGSHQGAGIPPAKGRGSIASPIALALSGNVREATMSPCSMVTATLHIAIEAICFGTESERAAVLIRSDALGMKSVRDMQCVCFVGGAHLSTQQIRLPMEGIMSTVLTSGIALNLSNFGGDASVRNFDGTARSSSNEAHSMLCVPIYPLGHNVAPVGILQLVNRMGHDSYTPSDEAMAHHAATQLSYVLFRYPVATKCQALDCGKALHQLVPFVHREHTKRHASILGADVPRELVDLLEDHVVPQLIFRSRHVEQFMRKGVVATGKALFLETKQAVGEMGEYIENLESCWRSTTEEVIVMEKEQAASRNESKRRKVRLKLLEETLADTEHKCARYKNEYDKLTGVVNTVLSGGMVHFPNVKGASSTV